MPVYDRKYIGNLPFVGEPGVLHFTGDAELTADWAKLEKSSFAPLADNSEGGTWATAPDTATIVHVEVINNATAGGASIYVLYRDASGEDPATPSTQAIQIAPGQVLNDSVNGLQLRAISVMSPGAGAAVGWAKIGIIA